MKAQLLKILKTIVPLFIGVVLIWYSIGDLSQEQRVQLCDQIVSTDPLFLLLSLLLALVSHISRAYRWNFLLSPVGYQSDTKVNFAALMVGYVANLGVPRSGEFVKVGLVSKHAKIPYKPLLGTVITERLIDLVMLLLVVGLGFLLNSTLLISFLESRHISVSAMVMSLTFGVSLIVLSSYLLRKSDFKLFVKLRDFTADIYKGIGSVFQMKKRVSFIIHTIFIWMCYILMFYVVKFGVSGLENLSFSGVVVAFIAGSFAISTTNGGIGAYPLIVGLSLVLFDIDKIDGETYGWVIWTSQTLFNILMGVLGYIYLEVSARKR